MEQLMPGFRHCRTLYPGDGETIFIIGAGRESGPGSPWGQAVASLRRVQSSVATGI